jgi:tetratricopeptide (TPR) repeat protein
MSVFRVFRLGIRFAAWVTPHVQEWHKKRHVNSVEGERHLKARNWTEAEKYLTIALGERRRPVGQRFEMTLGIAEAQRKQGKIAEAASTLGAARALADSGKNRGLQLQALEAQADFELDQKNFGAAEQTLAQIDALEHASKRPDHKRVASVSRKLGTAMLNNGRSDDAMKAFERAAQLSEKAYGPDHVETADALTELGARYRGLGNHSEAQRCLRRALGVHRETTGADSLKTSHDLFHLASSLAESGDMDAAAAEYEKVLALRERQIGADREQTAVVQSHLAEIYLQAGRTSGARELLIHAIGVLDRNRGDERLEFAAETMAKLEETLNRPAEAVRWREKAARSYELRTRPPEEVAVPVKKYY